jgi:hypothetical protein
MTTATLETFKNITDTKTQCHHCMIEKYLKQNDLWNQELELLYNQEACN